MDNLTVDEGTFHFDAADLVYETHFPEYPVVPGSLIIHAFLQALQKDGSAFKNLFVENFSFREFLPPGVCRFRITRRNGNLECLIMKDGKKMASGTLNIET